VFQGFLKVSTTRNVGVLMLDSTDHITGKASLTLTITASKDGASFASITPTVTDLGSGVYNLALTTTHTNTIGDLVLHITGTAADPADYKWHVITELPGVVLGDTSGTTTLLGRIAGNLTLSAGAVTVGTNNDKTGYTVSTVSDKTGYSLSVTPPTAVQVRTEMDSNSTKLANLDVAISSRSTYAGGAVASVTAGVTVTTNNDKSGYSLTVTPATSTDVRTQVDAALDAVGTELSSIPSTTGTIRQKLNFLFQYFRNKRTITATTETVFKEDATTTVGTATLSDNGTTFTKGELN
jgi:hypothetical protein